MHVFRESHVNFFLIISVSLWKLTLDLKTPKHLHANNKATFNEVWSFTTTTTESNDNPVVCASINLFKLKVEDYASMTILINDTLPVASGFVIYAASPFQFNPNDANR